ncbi:phenylacetaldoxime dehydratase family protein [uncultured Roseibium sp.]|uniref:phenylacetaldoxime dehydratase family protein n=1 Tax=uncultured Roseibium sp. TaxID=1936171 RepID=UPI0032178734
MEDAIPEHLKTVRTRPARVREDYEPPYPSFVARYDSSVRKVVMAYFGIQARPENEGHTVGPLAQLSAAFDAPDGPGHWDRARYVDGAGFVTLVSIAYWDDPASFDRWFSRNGSGWTGEEKAAPVGTFTEILRPAVERYETLFSATGRPEGIAALAGGFSDMVREHAYWGGMRDRIPLSQTDAMAPSGSPAVSESGGLRRVVPHHNLCLIRSGQDWTDADDEERQMYFEDVEPALRSGMDFLAREGMSCGCFDNRYMMVVGKDGSPTGKSFAMSWWKSLDALERWSESHPTHVAIFGAAMRYLTTIGPAAKLRLYHEVTVAAEDEQFFEYRNCHPDTGMLRSSGR